MQNELENYIRSNLDELDSKKPGPAVLDRILEEMKSKRNERPRGIVIPFRVLKWAVACLVVAVCGIAWWYFKQQQPATEFAGLYNIQSAAVRINAVASLSGLKNEDNDVVDALVQLLDNDPNANVRLAAMDGLAQFYREPYVRRKLVASLKKQHDPVVQINLMDLLVRMREKEILPDLKKMVNDEKTHNAVKDFAWSGIMRLQPGLIN